jgi:hypothetical protein
LDGTGASGRSGGAASITGFGSGLSGVGAGCPEHAAQTIAVNMPRATTSRGYAWEPMTCNVGGGIVTG